MLVENYPIFSVIIPTYNREKLITRAVTSVLSQTFQNFELLIIDDGSVDNTETLINNIPDERIIYIKHLKNRGQNSALNTGIENAQGNYISFLDSDDEWLPTMLEKQYLKYLENHEFDCVYTKSGYKIEGKIYNNARSYSLEGFIYKEALKQAYITSPTTLSVKKNIALNFKFDFDNKLCQDDMYCLRLAKHFQFGFINENLGIIHKDAENQLTSNLTRKAIDNHDIINYFKDDIIDLCGKKIYSKHLFRVGILYLDCSDIFNSKRLFRESLKNYYNILSALYLFIFLLPENKVIILRKKIIELQKIYISIKLRK